MAEKAQPKITGNAPRLTEAASAKAATPTKNDIAAAEKSIKSPLLKSLFNAKATDEKEK